MEIIFKWLLLIWCLLVNIYNVTAFDGKEFDLYAKTIKKNGKGITSQLAKGEDIGKIAQECEKLGEDVAHILTECRKDEHTELCRKWWHDNRQLYFVPHGQILFPTYVQFYTDLKDLIGKCKQWGMTEMKKEELATKFGHYFIQAGNGPAAVGNAPAAREVTIYYYSLFQHENEHLYHTAIFVHNSVIHYEGPRGIYVETLPDYLETVEKNGDKINSIRLPQTRRTPEQVQAQLDHWIGAIKHGHDGSDNDNTAGEMGRFAAGEYKRSTNNCTHFAIKFVDFLYANNTEQWIHDFMSTLKGSPSAQQAFDDKNQRDKVVAQQFRLQF